MSTIFDTPPRRDPTSHIDKAASEDDIEKVRALLKDHPGLVFSKDRDGRTPLHYAACNRGCPDLVEFLLTAKANDGATPLHEAEAMKEPDVAKLLRQHGAGRSFRPRWFGGH